MALLPSETSDEYIYCFSSLYPNLGTICNHCWKLDQYLVYIYSVPLLLGASVMSIRQQCSIRNRKVYLENVPYQLKPSMIVCCFISNINWYETP